MDDGQTQNQVERRAIISGAPCGRVVRARSGQRLRRRKRLLHRRTQKVRQHPDRQRHKKQME